MSTADVRQFSENRFAIWKTVCGMKQKQKALMKTAD